MKTAIAISERSGMKAHAIKECKKACVKRLFRDIDIRYDKRNGTLIRIVGMSPNIFNKKRKKNKSNAKKKNKSNEQEVAD